MGNWEKRLRFEIGDWRFEMGSAKFLCSIRYLVILFIFFVFFVGLPAIASAQNSDPESLRAIRKSPTRAMISSLLLPGGGQFYTENYKRGLLFALAQGTLSGMTLYQHMKTEKAWDRYTKSGALEDYNRYTDHYDRRRTLLLVDIGVWLFAIADAYMGAHFYEFDRLSFSLSIKGHF